MTGVEVPDFSGVLVFVCLVIAVAAMLWTATRSDTDIKLSKIIDDLSLHWLRKDKFRKAEKLAKEKMEDPRGCDHTGDELCKREDRKNMQYDSRCGYIGPGKWECNCGKIQCAAFEDFGAVFEPTDGAPPVHPLPDRRAAVEHTKGKA